MLVLGLLVIAFMSTGVGIRLLAGAGWIWLGATQLLNACRNLALVRRIRIYADGSAEIIGPADTCTPAILASGSVVLERLAWLRLEIDDGPTVAELLAGNPRENKDWRRLQVIWRHLGSAT